MSVPIKDQIAELKREHAIRQKVYPTWVARERMSQKEADQHLERLSAAITTLEWVERNEAKIKGALMVMAEQTK